MTLDHPQMVPGESLIQTEFKIIKIVQPSFIPQTDTYFIGSSSNVLGGFMEQRFIHLLLFVFSEINR